MKNLFLLISVFFGLASCYADIEITVENPSDFDRSEIVEIAVEKLNPLPAGKAYTVYLEGGEAIPSQLTYDGNLIFQTNIKAKESILYLIKIGNPQNYPPKTYGRFITERKDDFAWENDRVAFRIYGQALIPIDGPSNGLDFWYKRTDQLVVDKWYKDDLAGKQSYHNDNGEGLDDYKVGRSLGGGAMAPYPQDSLVLNENFTEQKVLENGPLRTTFQLTYKDITVEGETFSESRTFSIDAGSNLTKVTQEYGTKEPIPVAAGIVKRSEDDAAYPLYTQKGTYSVVYEEPASEKVGKVFVGMVFPKGVENVKSDTYTIIHPKTKNVETHSHVLAITTYYPGQPITYFTGFGWDKFGFASLDEFINYLSQFSKAIEEPLIIKVL